MFFKYNGIKLEISTKKTAAATTTTTFQVFGENPKQAT